MFAALYFVYWTFNSHFCWFYRKNAWFKLSIDVLECCQILILIYIREFKIYRVRLLIKCNIMGKTKIIATVSDGIRVFLFFSNLSPVHKIPARKLKVLFCVSYLNFSYVNWYDVYVKIFKIAYVSRRETKKETFKFSLTLTFGHIYIHYKCNCFFLGWF